MGNKDDLIESLIKELSAEEQTQLAKSLGIIPELPINLAEIDDSVLYTTTDVSKLLNFTVQHIARLCRNGTLHSIQVDYKGKHLICGLHIKEFLKRNLQRKTVEKFLNKD